MNINKQHGRKQLQNETGVLIVKLNCLYKIVHFHTKVLLNSQIQEIFGHHCGNNLKVVKLEKVSKFPIYFCFIVCTTLHHATALKKPHKVSTF